MPYSIVADGITHIIRFFSEHHLVGWGVLIGTAFTMLVAAEMRLQKQYSKTKK